MVINHFVEEEINVHVLAGYTPLCLLQLYIVVTVINLLCFMVIVINRLLK